MAIHRILTLNSDWDINCLVINVSRLWIIRLILDRVKIKYRSLIIDSSNGGGERIVILNPIACHMNSSRFYPC